MCFPPILIPACNSSSPACLMLCSVYKLNKQGEEGPAASTCVLLEALSHHTGVATVLEIKVT